MASGPITSWQIEGGKVEVVTDFLFLGSKIIVDGDCSHEIRRVLLGRKAMTNLDSVLKSRDISLPTKVYIVKAMVFPVVIYGCESWTVKKAECQRIDTFELWCWRLLRVPRTARRSNQSILNAQWEDWCWSSSILVTWCEQMTHWKSPWCWERLSAEGEKSIRGWVGWMASQMQRTRTWANFRRWWGTGRPGELQSMGSQRVGYDWATEQQQYRVWQKYFIIINL